MPKVPTYDGPQVRTAPLQGGLQDAGAYTMGARENAALGAALGRAGEQLDRVVMRNAEAQANTVDVAIDAGWREWVAKSAKEFRGERSGEFTPAAEAWWKDTAAKHGEGMDPLARRMVNDTLNRRKANGMASLAQHVEVEQEKHADAAAAAAIDAAAQRGISTGDIAGARADIEAKIGAISQRKKWDAKQTEDAMFKAMNAMHVAYTLQLVEKDAAAASAYYTTNKEGIPLAQQQRIEGVIKAEGDNQYAAKKAAEIAPLPFEEQLTVASKETDPKRRDALLQNIKINEGLKTTANQAKEKKASDTAWQLVGQGKKVPEATLAAMDGKERVQLQDYLRQRTEHFAKNGAKPVVTDAPTHRMLWAASNDDPEAFKKITLQTYGMQLATSDYEQLVKRQEDLRNPKKEADLVSFANKVKHREEMLKIAVGQNKQQERGAFGMAAAKLVEDHTARTGKPPSPKEEDALLDSLMLPGKVPFFSGNAKTYAESIATGKAFVPDIEDADRALIIQALRNEGSASPTPAQVIERFKLVKGLK